MPWSCQTQQPRRAVLKPRPPNIKAKGRYRDLVNSLRMRPDESSSVKFVAAALDMLQAMNTGHEARAGPANSPIDALSRLEVPSDDTSLNASSGYHQGSDQWCYRYYGNLKGARIASSQ